MAIDTQQVDLQQTWKLWDRDRGEIIGYVFDCDGLPEAEDEAYWVYGPLANVSLLQVEKVSASDDDMRGLIKAFQRSGLPSPYGGARGASNSWQGDPRPQGPEFG